MDNVVIQRFRHFIKENEKSNKLFCEKIGISESTLKSLFQRNALPTTEILLKVLSEYPEFNINWLFFGGNNQIESTKLPIAPQKETNNYSKSIDLNTSIAVKLLIDEIKSLTLLNDKNERELMELKKQSINNIAATPKTAYGK